MSQLTSVLGIPFLVCLLMGLVLGYLGLHVLKREVIFIDIAMAQIAAVGAILGHMIWEIHFDSPMTFVIGFASALVAALFFAVVRRYVPQISLEAVIGISYAAAASAALFLIGKFAEGHTHIQNMLAGSLLWADAKGLLWSGIIFGTAGWLFHLFRRPLQRISDNYNEALTDGLPVVFWDFVFYALCGAVIAQAVRIAGVVVTFIFLIVPATISALYAVNWRARLLISWGSATCASIFGLLFAYTLDFSAGVSVALFVGLTLIVLSVIKKWRSRKLT
jgi:zinc/manganese transport system permease protein